MFCFYLLSINTYGKKSQIGAVMPLWGSQRKFKLDEFLDLMICVVHYISIVIAIASAIDLVFD
ncbi:MAG: hypothetical protein NWQ43_10105 [Dolichospermum sp.]|nr:hypothetical protein [Dolichospermum sp.]